ncbi:hypothetical protein IM792_11355 [Mucilaginibacter sp. JRF]|uniref:hypothetical protein n=1 Tax=Mucilaginibacter sp. JRF TaxID=2780088 RepID=UPI001882A9E0|nr:hypothetical protein [Mucilaginibacter sp. JRF]MBE9585047.1 hypothetical protein [Mucilaginibacter sp. JRF]
MKKLILLAAMVVFLTNAVLAQSKSPSLNFNYPDLAGLKILPKSTRDSMIREIRKSTKQMAKEKTVSVNGSQTGGKIAKATMAYYSQIATFMIQVLENPNEALINRNVRKVERLSAQFEFDMRLYAEEEQYKQERQRIIDEFNSEEYEDAGERRDARKEMKEDLKDLDEDYKDTIKDMKDERKDRLEEEAEQDREDV